MEANRIVKAMHHALEVNELSGLARAWMRGEFVEPLYSAAEGTYRAANFARVYAIQASRHANELAKMVEGK
jgi:hypothetical protein